MSNNVFYNPFVAFLLTGYYVSEKTYSYYIRKKSCNF